MHKEDFKGFKAAATAKVSIKNPEEVGNTGNKAKPNNPWGSKRIETSRFKNQ